MPYDELEDRLQDHESRLARLERLTTATFACDECGKDDYTSAAAAAACCRD